MDKDNIKESFYSIFLVFEVDRDVLNDTTEDVASSRNILYKELNKLIPTDYNTFSSSLVIYQVEDTFNYLVVYSTFLKGDDKLPMDGYLHAKDIKDKIKDEFVEFFNSINLDFKLINTKLL